MPPDSAAADSASTTTEPRQHGVKGVYYAGDWVDIEDLDGTFYPSATAPCSGCDSAAACPAVRSRSRNFDPDRTEYDVVIVGAGCVGASVARELSKYDAAGGVLWVEAADDVSQGATKGNSGIVHAGYDDEPGSVRARYCWRGNQMFAALDGELRFGYQRNGSLVLAFTERERAVLHELYDRGRQNGVERLQIIEREEVLKKEPHVNPNVVAALYSPDAGNVIPYEFAIALAENAVDNGVQLMVRTTVKGIKQVESGEGFEVHLETWEPAEYLEAVHHSPFTFVHCALGAAGLATVAHWLVVKLTGFDLGTTDDLNTHLAGLVVIMILFLFQKPFSHSPTSHHAPLKKLVEQAGRAVGAVGGPAASTRDRVTVDDMLVGGSGSERVTRGVPTGRRTVKCRYVVNAAGGAADRIASMIGDGSFTIKPRLGDYLLLNRNQGHLTKHTLFPCPDPVLGKGVLVQQTLWGNLILGPTARDIHKKEAWDMSPQQVQEYILSKCKALVPGFDPKETIHAFCGARAKSDRGDWIIEPSKKNPRFIHVAGIDSPGLAGAPAIAVDVCGMLQKAGLKLKPNPNFVKDRAPIITPKQGMRGLKMGPVGKFDSDGISEDQMAANVICKCEKVTELEVVRAMRRSLPIDSSQAIRKRTRAGMGHCQGDPDNYNCEARVRAIIARESGVPVNQTGGRPWPATSTLSQRWIDDEEKKALQQRMKG